MLDWKRLIAIPSDADLPPLARGADEYVLAYDETIAMVVYAPLMRDGVNAPQVGRAWAFDGQGWQDFGGKGLDSGAGLQGHHDVARGGVVAWRFDGRGGDTRTIGLLLTSGSTTPLETRGDAPVAGEGWPGAFAYDRARNVTVCVTALGVWELDVQGTWRRRAGAGIERWDRIRFVAGGWDPEARRCSFCTSEGGENPFFAWDGAKLERVEVKGLPFFGVTSWSRMCGDRCAVLGGGPHGWLAYLGREDGLRALRGTAWQPAPTPPGGPGVMYEGNLAYDPGRNLVVLGPACHEEADAVQHQRVFCIGGAAWQQQGRLVVPPAIRDHQPVINTSDRYLVWKRRELEVVEWGNGRWTKLPSAAPEGKHDWQRMVADDVGRLHVFAESGAVARLEDGAWKLLVAGGDPFKERDDFSVVHDPKLRRFVLYGGYQPNSDRDRHDTFFFEDDRWRVPREPSPAPRAKRFCLVYDAGYERVLRVAREGGELGLLDGECWRPFEPKKPGGDVLVLWDRFPLVNDPHTGETLYLDVRDGQLWRIAVDQVEVLVRAPEPFGLNETQRINYHTHYATYAHDVSRGSVVVQHESDSAGLFELDLQPAFAAAAALGKRNPLGPAAAAAAAAVEATLYTPQTFWHCSQSGPEVIEYAGRLGAAGEEQRRTLTSPEAARAEAAECIARHAGEGTPADRLPDQLFQQMFLAPTRWVSFEGTAGRGRLPVDRVGGLPSSVTAALWPRRSERPLGFLWQMTTPGLLAKHAGFQVFVGTHGGWPELVVRLVSQAELDGPPAAEPPPGLSLLPARPLSLGPRLLGGRPTVCDDLAARDPKLAARLAKLPEVEASESRLGGRPGWLQSEETPKRGTTPYVFVAQLAIDHLRLLDTWPDTQISEGVVYVFAAPDEAEGRAILQYT
jgi:hypothetical protein